MLVKGNKILFISQYAGFIGGLERTVADTARLLRANGFRTYSIYAERVKGDAEFLSAFDGSWDAARLDDIDETFDLATLHKIVDPALLERLVARFSPTVWVHDHDYYCPKGYRYLAYQRKNCNAPYRRLPCALCASLVPPRHFAGRAAAFFKNNFFDAARRFAAWRTCPRFVVLSEFMRGCLALNGIPADRVRVLHPIIAMPDAAGTPVSPPRVVFIGQQVMSKGTPYFLDAIRRMRVPCEALVVGTGPRLEDFKRLSAEMGLADRVRFTGWCERPRDILMGATVGVFPSMWQEPFGLSGPEAMACGVPVVGFDVGGVSEWLKDGVNGRLVPPRDTAKMAAALDELVGNRAERDRLGAQGRAYVAENYSEEKFLKGFCEL